jgi:hypothetical protein
MWSTFAPTELRCSYPQSNANEARIYWVIRMPLRGPVTPALARVRPCGRFHRISAVSET